MLNIKIRQTCLATYDFGGLIKNHCHYTVDLKPCLYCSVPSISFSISPLLNNQDFSITGIQYAFSSGNCKSHYKFQYDWHSCTYPISTGVSI